MVWDIKNQSFAADFPVKDIELLASNVLFIFSVFLYAPMLHLLFLFRITVKRHAFETLCLAPNTYWIQYNECIMNPTIVILFFDIVISQKYNKNTSEFSIISAEWIIEVI